MKLKRLTKKEVIIHLFCCLYSYELKTSVLLLELDYDTVRFGLKMLHQSATSDKCCELSSSDFRNISLINWHLGLLF